MTSYRVALFALTALATLNAAAGEDSMPNMPRITPKKTYSVPNKESGEDLQDQRGFGTQEPMVRMMNLMMVEGSGAEGMDMSAGAGMPDGHSAGHAKEAREAAMKKESRPESAFAYEIKTTPHPLKVGTNIVDIIIRRGPGGPPAERLKAKSLVYMTSMDMGTDTPSVREISKGHYRLNATFSMKGPWAIKFITPEGDKIFDFDVRAGN